MGAASSVKDLEAIIHLFGLPEAPSDAPVPKEQVLMWAKSEEREALGALCSYVLDPAYLHRITPKLTTMDYLSFLPMYFERCIVDDSESDWVDGRYSAGWSVARWLAQLAREGDEDRKAISFLASWLADLYRKSDPKIRRAIVDAALEHAFEAPSVRKYFDYWAQDPELKVAHEEAMAWISSPKRRA